MLPLCVFFFTNFYQFITIMIAEAMTFKEQCIYWHNYFRTLHQVRKETEATRLTCMTFSIIITDRRVN